MHIFDVVSPSESETDVESSSRGSGNEDKDVLENNEGIDGYGQKTSGTMVLFYERLTDSASLPLQRISFALRKLKDFDAKTILELGCGDLSNGIKWIRMIKEFTSITGVDIDPFELGNGIDFALEGTEYPQRIRVFTGDLTEPCKDWLPPPEHNNPPDAVLCLEVLEHLESNPLRDLPKAVFGMLQPSVAIFTTPNKDYNIVLRRIFGRLTYQDKFRHWDHKFEWTREEFRNWCTQVEEQYPEYSYELEDTGTVFGTLPEEILDHGRCSSVATFVRDSTKPLRYVDWPQTHAERFL